MAYKGVRSENQNRKWHSCTAHPTNLFLGRPQPSGKATATATSTTLFMYNLPPSGGGNKDNDLANILKGVGVLTLVVLFFSSPLGGLVLGFFNSLIVLSIALPILGTIAFQTWEYFNTIQGPCPNCAAPVRVLKTNSDGEVNPSICFNCGAVIQANYENTGIDNVTGRNTIDDLSNGASIFDIFGGRPLYTETTTTTILEEKPKKPRKADTTIIDVEIEDIDKPFQ
jgi:hypothetical protein